MKLEYDDYLDGDDLELDEYEDNFNVHKKVNLPYEVNESENFDNDFNPFLCESVKIEGKLDDLHDINIECDDDNNNNDYLLSDEENLEFNNSSSSGRLSADGTDYNLRKDLSNEKRKFSNEMERQRRKQYSQSLDRVKEVLPQVYITRARENLGRKNMKKASYQVLLEALCLYLGANKMCKTDNEEHKGLLKSQTDEIKKIFKSKSNLLDESFKNEIVQFIQESNNLMCSK